MPVPVVLVTAAAEGFRPNMITIAWTGIVNSEPPMVYVSIRPSRHTYELVRRSGEYVINVPSVDQVRQTDYCGVVSGRDVDKFKETGLTPVPAAHVKAPLIKEFPVNLECRVVETVKLPTHDVFIGEVLAVHFNEEVLNENGRVDVDKVRPYAFCMQEYRTVVEQIGGYGFSKGVEHK
ncbi:MAG: flavin reductase family protein [Eubacteriales bacterium]|jgi:flavin reductase (DIM6/NTAB) family NADH-FMN oxidoreductase RutF|nr:flavin reductase family protein [Bacillota bacterium]MBV1734610.1 flavin reductase family protein [Desulforudis sp.]MDQ7789451.1 flavin reductase family protein [Clostridia bacterium]MDZ4043500.1 flavin reductase family protein [Eubacteriales bacterium]MDZ7609361.1 flavin reductase family protein [Eubacteriales bacterium]